MTVESDTQELLELFFDPYKVLFFEIDGFRAEYFLAKPDTFGDFDAIFVALPHPEDNPKNFVNLPLFVEKAHGRPVFVTPVYQDSEVERLAIEHGASGVIVRSEIVQFETIEDQARLLNAQRR